MEMDENFINRLALELTELRVRVSMLRSFIDIAGIPNRVIDEEIEKVIDAGLESEQFRQIYEMVLKHLSGGD